MKTLILDNYDSFTYNIFQYCAELGGNPEVIKNDGISVKEIARRKYTHIIISPGPGSPEKKKDFGVCGDVITKFCGKIPVLGICLGHQGIIREFGGKIVRAPVPVHGKRSFITVNNKSPLFSGLPPKIEAMRYHSLIGDKKSLPSCLEITAETRDGLIMAVSHKKFELHGVQFHPESIGTPHGKQILKNFLSLSMNRASFSRMEAENVLNKMATGKMPKDEMENILLNMTKRGESEEEIIGMVRGMRNHALKFPASEKELMDNCSTGGSGLSRMNISTTAAFVLSACGVKIAKHGNKAASGRSGSFDLLEALGVNIHLPPEKTAQAITKIGIGFLFAPLYHPAMKNIAHVRKKIGARTIFNLLGPLTNPAKPAYHLLGATSVETAKKLISALKALKYKRAIVAAGSDGLDDVTLTGKSHIFELKNGKIKSYEFSPEDIGIKSVKNFKNISGGNAAKNAELFKLLLNGKGPKPLRQLLLINSAFGLLVANKVKNLKEGLKKAINAVDSGAALEKFLAYKNFSNEQ